MTKAKVCGITNRDDALMCVLLGAEMIGCIVEVGVETPREVSAGTAREIFAALPRHVTGIAVTTAEDADEVLRIIAATGASAVQLHGKEPLELVKEVRSRSKVKVIKTIHVVGEESVREAVRFADHCDTLLLETPSKGLGGSGSPLRAGGGNGNAKGIRATATATTLMVVAFAQRTPKPPGASGATRRSHGVWWPRAARRSVVSGSEPRR